MEQAEREAIMRQGVVLPETPRTRREREALEEDLRTMPSRGQPLRLRALNFRPAADSYLAAARGPLAYMVRLRVIESLSAEHVELLAAARETLAREAGDDDERFARDWRETAERWSFDEVNDLIERHNRWYPVESRLPMDPERGDFALVNGRDYRLRALDSEWVLERFPPQLEPLRAAS